MFGESFSESSIENPERALVRMRTSRENARELEPLPPKTLITQRVVLRYIQTIVIVWGRLLVSFLYILGQSNFGLNVVFKGAGQSSHLTIKIESVLGTRSPSTNIDNSSRVESPIIGAQEITY